MEMGWFGVVRFDSRSLEIVPIDTVLIVLPMLVWHCMLVPYMHNE